MTTAHMNICSETTPVNYRARIIFFLHHHDLVMIECDFQARETNE